MIDVEKQQGFGVIGLEFLKGASLPAFGEILRGFNLFFEEAALVGNFEKIEHGDNHLHVGDEDGLCQIGGEFGILRGEPLPEAGHGVAQIFGIELSQMRTNLEAFVDLVRP